MVRYNEIRISNDGQSLLLDIIVAPYAYYERMHISQVCVDTEETFVAGSPSSSAVTVYDNTESANVKRKALSLCASDLGVDSLSGHLFYVYTACGGVPDTSIPCMMDLEWTLGVCLDWRKVYNSGMGKIRDLMNTNCALPRYFTDWCLKYEAFTVALNSGQYPLANELFTKWFKDSMTTETSTTDCGCNK